MRPFLWLLFLWLAGSVSAGAATRPACPDATTRAGRLVRPVRIRFLCSNGDWVSPIFEHDFRRFVKAAGFDESDFVLAHGGVFWNNERLRPQWEIVDLARGYDYVILAIPNALALSALRDAAAALDEAHDDRANVPPAPSVYPIQSPAITKDGKAIDFSPFLGLIRRAFRRRFEP